MRQYHLEGVLEHQRVIERVERCLAAYPSQIVGESFTEAAVVVAITEGFSEPAIILTRRSMHMKIHPGEAAFPGGKQDPEDESLLATALREANEEVGLSAGDFRLLGRLDQRVTRTNIKVTPFVGVVPEHIELTPNDGELDCIYTVPLSFFCDPDNMLVTEKPYRGKMQKVPYFEYQDHGIWGVTAMMVVDLVNVVFDAGLSVDKH